MIVVPKKQVLLLYVQDPDRVLNAVPTAKPVVFTGRRLVAVPHKLPEVKVLRALGFDAPSPVKHYYDWPGRFAPFSAQKETAEFLTLNDSAFVLNDLGTGKTMSTLWAYDYLRGLGLARRALVVSSLSTLERVWGDEIFRNFPHLNFHVLHGDKKKRLKLLESDADVYIINHDGVKVQGFVEAMAARPDIDVILIDEIAQVARNAGADRWKALNKLCNKQSKRRVWGMTGKPTPNAPTDAWAQCRLVVPDSVPPYFNRFRDTVMRQVGPFAWLPREDAVERVHAVMQPAIRFTRDQCHDLPPCIFQTRSVEFTAEQKKAYKEMVATLRTEIENDEVTAVNEAVKVGKLLQIACGVAYGGDGKVLPIDCKPRMDVLQEIVDEAEGKIIVFVPFVGAVEHVAKELANRIQPLEVATIHGGTSKQQRDVIFERFQKDQTLRVLVAQPAAMAHGLTLTEANTIVWFSAITSNEIYEQANGRITRPGQVRTQFVINLEGSPVERRLYERLKNKQHMQGLLLDLVRGSVDPERAYA